VEAVGREPPEKKFSKNAAGGIARAEEKDSEGFHVRAIEILQAAMGTGLRLQFGLCARAFAAFRSECFGDPERLLFHLLEPLKVRAEAHIGLGAVLKTPEIGIEFGRPISRKGVDHPVSVPTAFDHPVLPEVGELLGDLDLGDIQKLLEVADAKRAVRQKVDDAKARCLA
jgi:hypothetical protein